MHTINVHTEEKPFFIERCEQCYSLFFDPGELDAFVNETVQNVFSIDALTLNGLTSQNNFDEVRYRKCPICRKLMNRINFGRSSGVILDECREHGIFLDAGELRRILQWTRAGGNVAQSQRDLESQASAELRKRQDQREKEKKGLLLSTDPYTQKQSESLLEQIADFLLRLMK